MSCAEGTDAPHSMQPRVLECLPIPGSYHVLVRVRPARPVVCRGLVELAVRSKVTCGGSKPDELAPVPFLARVRLPDSSHP